MQREYNKQIHILFILMLSVVMIYLSMPLCYADTATVPVTMTIPASDIVMLVPETPQTGDGFSVYPYMAAMITALCTVLFAIFKNRSKDHTTI